MERHPGGVERLSGGMERLPVGMERLSGGVGLGAQRGPGPVHQRLRWIGVNGDMQ